MTKKVFEQLAVALKGAKPAYQDPCTEYEQWSKDVEAVAGVCQKLNPRFNRQRWLEAVGE